MRNLTSFLLLLLTHAALSDAPPIPLPTGRYEFHVRYTEHPSTPGPKLIAEIVDNHIELINVDSDDVFPFGVIASGTLMWHETSQRWIIGHGEDDLKAPFVGGCSDGPDVVDLVERIWWTC